MSNTLSNEAKMKAMLDLAKAINETFSSIETALHALVNRGVLEDATGERIWRIAETSRINTVTAIRKESRAFCPCDECVATRAATSTTSAASPSATGNVVVIKGANTNESTTKH